MAGEDAPPKETTVELIRLSKEKDLRICRHPERVECGEGTASKPPHLDAFRKWTTTVTSEPGPTEETSQLGQGAEGLDCWPAVHGHVF